jgi:hypothetical protein
LCPGIARSSKNRNDGWEIAVGQTPGCPTEIRRRGVLSGFAIALTRYCNDAIESAGRSAGIVAGNDPAIDISTMSTSCRPTYSSRLGDTLQMFDIDSLEEKAIEYYNPN